MKEIYINTVFAVFEDHVSPENKPILALCSWYYVLSMMLKQHQPLFKSLNKLKLLKKYFYEQYLSLMAEQ